MTAQTNGASANVRDLTPQGEPLALNTLTVFNAALSLYLNWEGNLRSLELEVEQTLSNPAIMGSNLEEILGKLRSDPDEVRQFRDAYGHGPDRDSLLDAIAVFERSVVTPGSRFDRWLARRTVVTRRAYASIRCCGPNLVASNDTRTCSRGRSVRRTICASIGHGPADGPPLAHQIPR